MQTPHLFWILIDSARNYQTDKDMRGLPQAVLDFGKEGLYFENVITSAPSTIQSVSSMMTSSPSYLLSRSYNNYRGRFSCFDYFPDLLRANGYDTIGAIYFKHGREVMSDMFGPIKKDFYPDGLTHSKEVWTNKDVYYLFQNVLTKHDWTHPTMTYLHFNVRVDINVSDIINDVIKDIRSKGLYEKSVILINSDHGYPDADKNYDFEESLKEGWGHDKYLTNDNILTPLVIRYPGVTPRVIKDPVATIDIVPTLCSIMGLPASSKFHGININVENLDPSSRLIRTDNRYVGQSPSYYAYTKGNQKMIGYRKDGREDVITFYNLENDPYENNGTSLDTEFKTFYGECNADEKRLHNFHEEFLRTNWRKRLTRFIKANPKKIVLVIPSTETFRAIALNALQGVFSDSEIHLYDDVEILKETFDLKIYLLETEIPWELRTLVVEGKGLKAKTTIFLDNNGDYLVKPIWFTLYRNFISKRWPVIKDDPRVLAEIIKRVLKKKRLNPVR